VTRAPRFSASFGEAMSAIRRGTAHYTTRDRGPPSPRTLRGRPRCGLVSARIGLQE
jgi:hypothetical protein